MKHPVHHTQLGYLSLLPFLLALAWPLLTGSSALSQESFAVYSTGLFYFWLGAQWRPGEQSVTRANLSLLLLLITPVTTLFSYQITLLWLAVGYWLVFMMEQRSRTWQTLHPDYQKMRWVTTSVAFVCHLFVFAMGLDRPAGLG